MGLRINQNIAALNSYRNLSVSDSQLSKSLEKLSSGFRINRAADDAAGLVVSESLRAQTNGLKVAVRNAQDGVSVVQTAEGALNEVHSILQRVRDLALQASNANGNTAVLDANQAEVDQLLDEIDRISGTTKFGDTKLLAGDATTPSTAVDLKFVVGAGATDDETITVSLKSVAAEQIGRSVTAGSPPVTTLTDLRELSSDADGAGAGTAAGTLIFSAVDGTTGKTWEDVLQVVDGAIANVSEMRGDLGAVQNRFEHTVSNLNVAIENLSASESRIRDTDMAMEMVSFTRHQILAQAGTAMLAQANAAPQSVLALLRG